MNKQEYRYDAFISYRHLKTDINVAKTLHKKLELLTVPRSLWKKHTEVKNGINRVFRDQEELNLSTSLRELIDNALKDSEWLIVIATNSYQDSEWCRRELDTFLELRGRDKILVVLGEGDPTEVIPRVLWPEELKNKENLTDEDISRLYDIDVRAKTRLGVRRNIGKYINVIAEPILHLSDRALAKKYRKNQLWKKHSIRLFITFSILVQLGVICFFVYYAYRKTLKNYEIDQSLTDEVRLAETLEDLYLYEKSDIDDALRLSLELLDKYGYDACPESRFVLFNSLDLYSTGDDFTIRVVYNTWGKAEYAYCSVTAQKLVIWDDSYTITVLDSKDGTEIIKIPDCDMDSYPCQIIADEFLMYKTAGNKPRAYSLADEKYVELNTDEAYEMMEDAEPDHLNEHSLDYNLSFDDEYYAYKTEEHTVIFMNQKVADDLVKCTSYQGDDYGDSVDEHYVGTDKYGVDYFVQNHEGHLKNSKGDNVGTIPRMIDFDAEGNIVYLKAEDGTIYMGPVYSLEELYEKAKR